MLSSEDQRCLDVIRQIRTANNDYWMELLEIALDADPVRTKKVLSAIRSNDEAISMITKELSDAPKAKISI